jgi:hypothetical protein
MASSADVDQEIRARVAKAGAQDPRLTEVEAEALVLRDPDLYARYRRAPASTAPASTPAPPSLHERGSGGDATRRGPRGEVGGAQPR